MANYDEKLQAILDENSEPEFNIDEPDVTEDTLRLIRKRLRGKRIEYVPQHEDKREELRRLCREHNNTYKHHQRLGCMVRDRKFKDGTILRCTLPEDIKDDISALRVVVAAQSALLVRHMEAALADEPLWRDCFKDAYGVGPKFVAYLLAFTDWEKAEKPSNLIRCFGNGNNRSGEFAELEMPWHAAGSKEERKLHYSTTLRAVTVQTMIAMRMTRGQRDFSTKYLDVWDGYKYRMAHSPRVSDDGKFIDRHSDARGMLALSAGVASVKKGRTARNGTSLRVVHNETGEVLSELRSARKFIDTTGRRKATDVLLEDCYIMGRALAGLPVWPSWYAGKLGYEHGGKIVVKEPRLLTPEQARELIGDLGKLPRTVRLAA